MIRALLTLTTMGLLTACAAPGDPSPSGAAPSGATPSLTGSAPAATSTSTRTLRIGDPPASGELLVEVLDVGQGDAILLRIGDKTALIDGGTGDKGEAVWPHLQSRQLLGLDLMVSTHPHADHIGGLDEVISGLKVKLLLDNGLPHTTDSYARLMQLVEQKKVPYKAAKVGQSLTFGTAKLQVLNPGTTPLSGTRSDLNSNSVVLRLSYGDVCMLFTGDSEEPTEEALLQRGLTPCDVLKVAHHGGEHSTHEPFLSAVRPQIALISAGVGNDYGHPRQETLTRLKSAGAAVFRTDEQGTLALSTDGRSITVTPERGQSQTFTAGGAGGASTTTGSSSSGSTNSALLDVNTATQAQLAALPGLGDKLAQAILDDRKKNGRFGSVDELDRVPGIGPATISKLRPLVTAR